MSRLWKTGSCHAAPCRLPKEVTDDLPPRCPAVRPRTPREAAVTLLSRASACADEKEKHEARRDPATTPTVYVSLTPSRPDHTSIPRGPGTGTETHRRAVIAADSLILPSGAGQADGHGSGEHFDARSAGPGQ